MEDKFYMKYPKEDEHLSDRDKRLKLIESNSILKVFLSE